MTNNKGKANQYLSAPKRERGLRRTGYNVAGYPFAPFGAPTLLHAKKVILGPEGWRETENDCGGLLKPMRLWVNDLPNGYELVVALQCQDCKYSDCIRLTYSGPKQLFNSTSNRTWSLKEKGYS